VDVPRAPMASAASPVPMRTKVRNRLYEAIVMLDILIKEYKNEGERYSEPASSTLSQFDHKRSFETDFQVFVNKLSQVCDCQKGGATVTAFTILQFPGKLQYRFASNARNARSLELAKDYVFTILKLLGQADPGGDCSTESSIFKEILERVLVFNRPRLELYVEVLGQESARCMQDNENATPDDGELIAPPYSLGRSARNRVEVQHCLVNMILMEENLAKILGEIQTLAQFSTEGSINDERCKPISSIL